MNAQTAQLLRTMLQTFVDAVKEGGSLGAPGGVLYAAVMDKITESQFSAIMDSLVATGKLRRQGDLYFHVADL